MKNCSLVSLLMQNIFSLEDVDHVQSTLTKYRSAALAAFGCSVFAGYLSYANHLRHMCQIQARGPNLTRKLMIIPPPGQIKCTLELARGLNYIFYFKFNSHMFVVARFGCSKFCLQSKVKFVSR